MKWRFQVEDDFPSTAWAPIPNKVSLEVEGTDMCAILRSIEMFLRSTGWDAAGVLDFVIPTEDCPYCGREDPKTEPEK